MDVGRELDAAVAERVMGYTLDYEFADLNFNGAPCVKELRDQYDEWGLLPAYSTDIAAAWLVVEKLAAQGLRLSLDAFGGDPWWAEFADEKWERGAQATAPTASEAICRVALAAMEGTK